MWWASDLSTSRWTLCRLGVAHRGQTSRCTPPPPTGWALTRESAVSSDQPTTASLTPGGVWYVTTGNGAEGNLATAREASALQGYTLLDRATVLTLGGDLGLEVLLEVDPLLLNLISVLRANPARVGGVLGGTAAALAAWLLGPEAHGLIAEFGVARYGQPLFFPQAPDWSQTPTALTARQSNSP